MNRFFIIAAISLLTWACSTGKEAARSSATVAKSSQDSTEYEIRVIDPYFDQWYEINYSPAKDLTNDHYRRNNILAVATWNEYYQNVRYPMVIDSYIDYQPSIDYGLEVNRKLYWYFVYVREHYGIRLFR